jgi:hypothetical protein
MKSSYEIRDKKCKKTKRLSSFYSIITDRSVITALGFTSTSKCISRSLKVLSATALASANE